MILIAVISEETKNNIFDTEFRPGEKYNPVQYNGQWIISLTEAQFLGDPSLILNIIMHIPNIEEDEEI